jgi:putative protease
MELLCPAGSLPALCAALEEGADAIYIGFKDDTNARHFAGMNFTDEAFQQASQKVKLHGKKLHVAINTFAHPQNFHRWTQAVDRAVDFGADVLILSDIALLNYARTKYPDLELHLSVQASATNAAAIDFYCQHYAVNRIVLPRVLSLKQVLQLAASSKVELEVFAFGSLCIMSEGRCYLSSYLTGESPNTRGACSPAKYVEWQETGKQLETRLNGIVIDRYDENEAAAYPTLCKGRFQVDDRLYHALEEPTSLNTLELLPQLKEAKIAAVKIEGRQRSPAYVRSITRIWRAAIDAVNSGDFSVQREWMEKLSSLSEGRQTTLGAYERTWQ